MALRKLSRRQNGQEGMKDEVVETCWSLVRWNGDAEGGLETRVPEDMGKRVYMWSTVL